MGKYLVTVFEDIGHAIVEADTEEEAKEKILSSRGKKKDGLLDLFNNGYNANLQVRATEIRE